jgi:hypothetical protein
LNFHSTIAFLLPNRDHYERRAGVHVGQFGHIKTGRRNKETENLQIMSDLRCPEYKPAEHFRATPWPQHCGRYLRKVRISLEPQGNWVCLLVILRGRLIILFFQLQPERVEGEEEKFICYHCNNWLINWYSVEHPTETRIPYERDSSKSSSSSGNLQKRTKKHPSQGAVDEHESAEKENQNPQLPARQFVLDVAAVKKRIKCIERMREFSEQCGDYVPVAESYGEVDAVHHHQTFQYKKTKFKVRGLGEFTIKFKPFFSQQCYYCHKKFSNWIYRREHVQIIHPKKLKTKECKAVPSHKTAHIDETIVTMLKNQGTFITDESMSTASTFHNIKPIDFGALATTKRQKQQPLPKIFTSNCLQRNEANEIILSFNTVITEVVAKFNEKFVMKDEILLNFTRSLTANC